LNFALLLRLVQIAHKLNIPSTFVETNCFWCVDGEATRDKLTQLRDAGLKGILISVNPFIREEVPFERTEIAVRIGREVFGRNAIIYQEVFYEVFKRLESPGTMSFQEYLGKAWGSLRYIELLPMGRAVYQLAHLFRKYPAKRFFGESCRKELTRPWHVHVDNYGNYMTGYCGGISLGDARNLEVIFKGIDLNEYPVIEALVTGIKGLYEFGKKEFGYTEEADGYISKCHLCLDIRRHIAQQTDIFKELRPIEFYLHLG